MDVEQAMKMVDGGPYNIREWAEAATALAAEVRRLREVLAAYQIEAARERGGT